MCRDTALSVICMVDAGQLSVDKKVKEYAKILVSLRFCDKKLKENRRNVSFFMLTMIAAIAEFERQTLLDRQREGIAMARQRDAYKGRKKVVVKDFGKYYARYMRWEITKAGIAKELGVSRPTVDRLIKEYRENLKTQDQQ